MLARKKVLSVERKLGKFSRTGKLNINIFPQNCWRAGEGRVWGARANFPVDPVGKPLSYLNWEESVKRTVYGLANTLGLLTHIMTISLPNTIPFRLAGTQLF